MLSSVTHARTRPASCKATSGLTILIHVEGQSRGRIATTRGGNAGMNEKSSAFSGRCDYAGLFTLDLGRSISPVPPANQLELDFNVKITYLRNLPPLRQNSCSTQCL